MSLLKGQGILLSIHLSHEFLLERRAFRYAIRLGDLELVLYEDSLDNTIDSQSGNDWKANSHML